MKFFKSKKTTPSVPYNVELVVFVNVSIESLKEFSNDRLSKDNILDKINIDKIKVTKTKKAIFTS